MDKIQQRLGEMEQVNPSSEREGKFASQLRLNLRERLHKIEGVPQEHSYVAPVEENDYHQEIPENSPVKRYFLNEDGSLHGIDYKNGGSRYYKSSVSRDKQSYLSSLLKARELAEQGNPEFEIFVEDANRDHLAVWNCFPYDREGKVAELYEEIIEAFKGHYKTPSDKPEDLIKGMPKIKEVSGIERVELSRKCDGGVEVIFEDHTMFSLSPEISNGRYLQHQEVRVIHDNSNGNTMIQRSARGVPFVRITREDPDQNFFMAIFSYVNDGSYLLGRALTGQEVDYNLVGQPLKRLELLLQDNQKLIS